MHFLVLQHLDIEPPALFGESIEAAGHELVTVHPEEEGVPSDPFAGCHGLIVMGGPQSANDLHRPWIRDEIALLERAVDRDFPVIGICLGAQLLARAAGGEVLTSPLRELGWYPVYPTAVAAADSLFAALPAGGIQVFQWHGETFTLPPAATLLATHPAVANQAFRIGRAQYGLQFHIEVGEALIGQWIAVGESERTALGEAGIAAIGRDTARFSGAAHRLCHHFADEWLRQVAGGS